MGMESEIHIGDRAAVPELSSVSFDDPLNSADISHANSAVLLSSDDGERPMVSIGMTVYNQEDYVATAIESILKQKVNFSYEIVIAEDCSTDRSREIVIEYANKYPDVIKLILQEHNVGLRQQSICLKKTCRGIYRTQLEGDDFWLTEDKLQKQVDFLEKNKEYIGVSGQIICVNSKGRKCAFPYGDLRSIYCFEGDYTLEHFQQWLLPSHTGALLYRNVFYKCDESRLDQYESYDVMGDRKTALMLLSRGNIHIIPEEISVRRIDLNSESNFTSNSVKMKPYGTICAWMSRLEKMAMEMYGIHLDMSEAKHKQWIWALKNFGRQPSRQNLKSLRLVLHESREKRRYINSALDLLSSKIKRKIQKEGFFTAIGRMFGYTFKLAGKMIFRGASSQKGNMRVINSAGKS